MPNLPYELAKQLKDSGWPQPNVWAARTTQACSFVSSDTSFESAYSPSLSELIEACPRRLKLSDDWYGGFCLTTTSDTLSTSYPDDGEWLAGYLAYDDAIHESVSGSSPEEAVARLWLALKKGEAK